MQVFGRTFTKSCREKSPAGRPPNHELVAPCLEGVLSVASNFSDECSFEQPYRPSSRCRLFLGEWSAEAPGRPNDEIVVARAACLIRRTTEWALARSCGVPLDETRLGLAF